MGALEILTIFVILMVIGILLSLISSKIGMSNVLTLILAGLIMGAVNDRLGLVGFDETALLTIAILALVLIVFDGSSRFKAKSVEDVSVPAIKLILWLMLVNLVILTGPVAFLFYEGFGWINLLFGAIFSVMIAATDPVSIFIMIKKKSNRVLEFLRVEAILNTPITILIPLLIIDIMNDIGETRIELFSMYLSQFLLQVVVGIGTGIFVGMLFFRAMKKVYSDEISPLAMITAALLAYIMSENLDGSGILAVAVLGFVFGQTYVKQKSTLRDFNSMVSNSLEILVFLLLGFIISLEISFMFMSLSIFIFMLMMLARWIAMNMALRKHDFTRREKIFMTLSMPKGLATAVLVFSLSIMEVPGIDIIVNLVVMVMILSLLTSTILNYFSQTFIRSKLVETESNETEKEKPKKKTTKGRSNKRRK